MILQALTKHYENLVLEGKAAPEGWCSAKVSCAINISKDGEILNFISRKAEVQRGKKTAWVPTTTLVPQMLPNRSSSITANFLCDNSQFLLGVDADGVNTRTKACFAAAKERHLRLLDGVAGEMAQALRNFFENWDPDHAAANEVLQEDWEAVIGGNLIFCMGGEDAQDDAFIREAWENRARESNDAISGVCLVTGKKAELASFHHEIKGIPGAQPGGAKLVSFNAPAFKSYGKEQGYNAPVGVYAEFAYTTALNYLLGQREYALQLGDSMVVFWSEGGQEAYQETFFESADPKPDNREMIHDLFANLAKHAPIYLREFALDPSQEFYILCLAPNAARLSVRFFYQSAFGEILSNIADHYKRMEIVKPAWVDEKEMIGVRKLLLETVNQKSKEKTPVPHMAALVLQAIISGSRYPASLYSNTLIRIRAEQGKDKITWGRAAIIKAYLIQNYHWEGEGYMGLNTQSTEEAYLLGRLFSVLESVQQDANPGIQATIRDRYFNSACATPASVFPILFRLKNSHIKKLEREKQQKKVCYEKLLTEILGKFGCEDMATVQGFPKRLNLEEQGKFILGYYHQTQKKYAKREEEQ